jgi:shikimate kinase
VRFHHVVLVGLMGSGKTSVGRALAKRLGLPFSDSDADIERTTGRTVAELAGTIGVEEMHELEAQQLLQALAEPTPSVIATAASTIDDPACRAALADPALAVVWLQAAPEALAKRFRSSGHRPTFGESPEKLLAHQAAERDSEFAGLDPIAIETGGKTVETTVEDVLSALTARARRPPG